MSPHLLFVFYRPSTCAPTYPLWQRDGSLNLHTMAGWQSQLTHDGGMAASTYTRWRDGSLNLHTMAGWQSQLTHDGGMAVSTYTRWRDGSLNLHTMAWWQPQLTHDGGMAVSTYKRTSLNYFYLEILTFFSKTNSYLYESNKYFCLQTAAWSSWFCQQNAANEHPAPLN